MAFKMFIGLTTAAVLGGFVIAGCSSSSNSTPDGGDTTVKDAGKLLPDANGGGDDSSAATCAAADVSTSYKPKWIPPKGSTASCSQAQLDGYGNCLDSNSATSAQCAPWLGASADPANATCAKCIAPSKQTDPSWGPLVDINKLLQINVAGCLAIALSDQAGTGCAGAFQALSGCESAACGVNCATATQTALDSCIQTADTTGSCSTYETSAACVNDASATAQACFGPTNGTFGKLFAAVAAPFCLGGGPPVDAGGDSAPPVDAAGGG